jgi:nucleotide-binding universal stress UspA family protein
MKRILVAVDGSERAKLVLGEAARLAQRFDAKIIVMRSVGLPVEMPPAIWKATDVDLTTTLVEHARLDVKDLTDSVAAGLVEESIVELGVAWDAICNTAKAKNVDLIVIGSHGYSGLDRLMGTTAGKVVNHADRSVLVVRGVVTQ